MTDFTLGDFPIDDTAPYSDLLKAVIQVPLDDIAATFDALPGLTAGVLLAANNLLELTDVPTARFNLDVFSKEETDTDIDNYASALFGATSGWDHTVGDVWLQPSVVSGGLMSGGVIRNASALQITNSYSQSVAPTDTAIGSPLLIKWDAVLTDTAVLVGPSAATGLWGPRGTIQVEGTIQYGANQGEFGIPPITFSEMSTIKNVPGAARTLTPGWEFMSARQFAADGATVTLGRNDTNAGGAAFVDSRAFITQNSGTFAGSTVDTTGFISAPFILGNTTLRSRIGYHVREFNNYLEGTADMTTVLAALYPGIDALNPTVATNIGLKIDALTRGTANVGIENASNYISWDGTNAGGAVKITAGAFTGQPSGSVGVFHDRTDTLPLVQINALAGTGYLDFAAANSAPDIQFSRASAGVLTLSGSITGATSFSGASLTAAGLTGSTAASRWVGATATGAPSTGAHLKGDWITTQDGGFAICTAAGTPGTWSAVSAIAFAAIFASTAQVVGLLGNNGGWTLGTDTDVYLPAATWSAGVLTGGQVRQATGLHLNQTYTQTAEPADALTGTPLLIELNATLTNTNSPYGPNSATSLYGPRGATTLQGITQIGANQSVFSFSPIGFADLLRVKNVVGANRHIVPGWNYATSRTTFADTNTVTLGGNDISLGTAGFVSNQTFMTANGGTLDGTTNNYELLGFLSMPFVYGNSHISTATGYKVNDLNQYGGTPGHDLTATLSSSGYVPGADTGLGTVDTYYGFYVGHLTQATRNIGLFNGSATVEPLSAVSITAVGNTLPIDATVVAVTASSALTLTSTPTIPAGVDGQRITYTNVGTHLFALQDEAGLTGSGLLVAETGATSGHSVGLNQWESITLRYSSAAGKWLRESRSNSHSTLGGPQVFWDGTASDGKVTVDATLLLGVPAAAVSVFNNSTDIQAAGRLWTLNGVPSLELGPGGTTATDVILQRTGTSAATLTGQLTIGTGLTFSAGKHLTLATTGAGTQIGTGATQLLGFYGATAVAQYATTGTATGFTAATGTAVLSSSTFTGNTGSTAYTLGDVVRALKLLGAIAA